MKLILLLFIVFVTPIFAESYNHPGDGSFLEVGTVKNKSPYGYSVDTFYLVPRLEIGSFTLESTKLNYHIIKTKPFSIGPMINYNFKPYDGTEINTLSNMLRKSYWNYGLLAELEVPLGRLFAQVTKSTHENPGYINKLSYGSGIPLLKLNSNYIWINLMFEYTYYSSSVVSYLFGVKEHEVTINREKINLENTSSFSQIYGLWTPVSKYLWINLTYRLEKFDKNILESNIVRSKNDQSILLGLMYSFNKI